MHETYTVKQLEDIIRVYEITLSNKKKARASLKLHIQAAEESLEWAKDKLEDLRGEDKRVFYIANNDGTLHQIVKPKKNHTWNRPVFYAWRKNPFTLHQYTK